MSSTISENRQRVFPNMIDELNDIRKWTGGLNDDK